MGGAKIAASIYFNMQELLEEIREQVHGIRNLIAPFDLKFATLEHNLAQFRSLFEQRSAALETKLFSNNIRLEQHESRICEVEEGFLQLSERMKRLEVALNPPQPEKAKPLTVHEEAKSIPVHEDKTKPEILPPQTSAI